MKNKKALASRILKTSPKKIKFTADALEEIKKAITGSDIRGLIAIKKITKSKAPHQSRVRARKIAEQKKKGRQKGHGSKKGKKFSQITKKERWMTKVRTQRKFIKELKENQLIIAKNYRLLYSRVKSGYFRNKRHIKLYIQENNLITINEK